MSLQERRDPVREYERETELRRQGLAEALAELNVRLAPGLSITKAVYDQLSQLKTIYSRLTPGQVLDEVLSYRRSDEISLARAARRDAVPLLLIGAGCLLLIGHRLGLFKKAGSHTDRS